MEVFAVMVEPYGFVDCYDFDDALLRLFVHEEDAQAYYQELLECGYDSVLIERRSVL